MNHPKIKIQPGKNGFTFVEVLATLAFLVILIPVVVEALTLSSRTAAVAERSSIAVELAENRLNELVMDGSWVTAETTGDFTERPEYHWELIQETWSRDNMVQLTMTVYFDVQGRQHQVSLSTLTDSSL